MELRRAAWALALAAVLWAGCDGAEEPLEDGTFRADIEGSIRERIEGQAFYSEAEVQGNNAILVLNLVTGTYQPPGGQPGIPTGVFISAPWTRQPGTYALEAQGGRFQNYVVLASAATFLVESGTLEVDEVANGRVHGSFELIARAPVTSGGGVVQVSGPFAAILDADSNVFLTSMRRRPPE